MRLSRGCISRSIPAAPVRHCRPVRYAATVQSLHTQPLRSRKAEDLISVGKHVHLLSRAGRMREAENLVQRMRVDGMEPNAIVYGSLIDGWCKANKPDEALSVLSMSLEHKQHQGPSAFTKLMGAFCNVGRFDDACSLLELMPKHNVHPNAFHFTVLLEALTQAGRLKKAEQVVVSMQQHKVDRDARAHAAIVGLYSLIEREAGMQEELDAAKATSVSSRLLRWSRRVKEAVNSNNPLLALAMLDTMSETGVHPNVVVFTTVVSGLARAGQVAKLMSLIDRMEREGVSPNEITYVSAIEGLRNAGQRSAAEPLLRRLKSEYPTSRHYGRLTHFASPQEQATPNMSALSIAVRDLVQQRRMAEAETLLAKRQREGIKPHVVTFNTMISGYAKLGKEEQVADVIRRMQAGGIGPTDVTCGAISDGIYAPDAAARLLNLVEQQPDRPLSEAYRAILLLHAKRGRVAAFDRLCAHTHTTPDVTVRQHLIAACAQQKLLARAMTELDALQQSGAWLDQDGVATLVKALAKNDRVSDAHALLFESRSRGVTPAALAHASVVYGWATARDFAKAESVLDVMLQSGPAPTAEVWKPIIYAYAEANLPEKADEKQRAMQEAGLPLDLKAAKAVLESWLRKGDTTRAKGVLLALERAGHPPEALSLFALGKAEMRAGHRAEGTAIFDRMRSLGMIVPSLVDQQ